MARHGLTLNGKGRSLAALFLLFATLRLWAQSAPAALNVPWTPLAPQTLTAPATGAAAGRILAVAADPSDATGNTVYIGAAGGLLKSTNAAGASASFAPVTDIVPAVDTINQHLNLVNVGAVTVQPGGTGVVLAGTGDPTQQPDSLYGTGLLRSADGGNTWTVIADARDPASGLVESSFFGEAFAGFAWSTLSPNTVVAAVTSAQGAVVANAGFTGAGGNSTGGLFYSQDAGQTWQMANVQDGQYQVLQAPGQRAGLVALAVVWNPVRRLFVAAIRNHGFYSSPDGISWTRLASQPGAALNVQICRFPGSQNCPIYSAALAVQPGSGDMYALTASQANADNGLWQDVCAAANGSCSTAQPSFARQVPIAGALETSAGVIAGASQALWLQAIPSGSDTLLLAGTQDIFRCSMAAGCVWRNATNVNGCAAAKVGANQHSVAWLPGSTRLYFANDGGLWRSDDAVNQQPAACTPDDAAHFTNLNGSLGSLVEAGPVAADPTTPGALFASLGPAGTAAGTGGAWQSLLPGPGGPVAVGWGSQAGMWFATAGAGVSISGCSQGPGCAPGEFASPSVTNTQVDGDGAALAVPAAWQLDPENPSLVFVATCRLWRGAVTGGGWSAANLLSGMLDGHPSPACQPSDTQISALAVTGAIAGRGDQAERVYVGMAGGGDGATANPGHVFTALVTPASVAASTTWTDLSNSPVNNDSLDGYVFNRARARVTALATDPTDTSGKTVYAAIGSYAGQGLAPLPWSNVPLLYGSTDGGSTWNNLSNNLPDAPINAVLIDPANPAIVYVGTDIGVFVTTTISQCPIVAQPCWSAYGAGLPAVRITSLTTATLDGETYLLAGTRGRGIWQAALASTALTAQTTSATLAPATLAFAPQAVATTSAAQVFTLRNTGLSSLTPGPATSDSDDFVVTDACPASLAAGASCQISVVFAPIATGPRSGTLTLPANVQGGTVTAAMTGTGTGGSSVVLTPLRMSFGEARLGQTTAAQYLTVANVGQSVATLRPLAVTGPFVLTANTCSATIAVNTSCTVGIAFAPTASGAASGTLVATDSAGTQTALLSGTGQTGPTDNLNILSLTFAAQPIGTTSAARQITVTNNGDSALNNIAVSITGPFAVNNLCGIALPGHSTCALQVVFQPTAVGAQQGMLTMQDALGTQQVALNGTGALPASGAGAPITLSPISMSFGIQGVGSISSPQLLTVINSSQSPLSGLQIAATAGYGITANACNVTVAPGAGCTVGITFSPAAPGPQPGTVKVTAAGIGTPFALPLTGTGADFQLSVQGASTSAVTGGNTATYQLLLTPVGASAGPVTFTCTGAPSGSTCSTNPATVTMTGTGATATIQVTVSTPASSAQRAPQRSWAQGAAGAAMLAGLLLWRPRRWSLLVALCMVCLGLGGCGLTFNGGNSGSPGGSGSSAQGNYTLTVQGGAPGVSHAVTLGLTVE